MYNELRWNDDTNQLSLLYILKQAFEQAAKDANNFTKLPKDDELLELYGLYKQATIGDNNTSKPLVDFKGRYKWDAWNNNNGNVWKGVQECCVAYFLSIGIPQVEAEVQYIELVERLRPLYE